MFFCELPAYTDGIPSLSCWALKRSRDRSWPPRGATYCTSRNKRICYGISYILHHIVICIFKSKCITLFPSVSVRFRLESNADFFENIRKVPYVRVKKINHQFRVQNTCRLEKLNAINVLWPINALLNSLTIGQTNTGNQKKTWKAEKNISQTSIQV